MPTGSLDIISRPARIGIPGLVSTDQASEHVLSLAVAHATATLNRHWLSVPERVTFKLCVMVYRCLHGIGPEYFSEDFTLVVSEIQSRQRLRSASGSSLPTSWFLPHAGLHLATELSQSQELERGTHCRPVSPPHHLCPHSGDS